MLGKMGWLTNSEKGKTAHVLSMNLGRMESVIPQSFCKLLTRRALDREPEMIKSPQWQWIHGALVAFLIFPLLALAEGPQ
ncbi:MAG TPA: hypothetical protein VKM56_02800, partial [Verrucomicrobiae bacterium]|nr:hypothetical protein [Verrucomicrobiae bacterium]